MNKHTGQTCYISLRECMGLSCRINKGLAAGAEGAQFSGGYLCLTTINTNIELNVTRTVLGGRTDGSMEQRRKV